MARKKRVKRRSRRRVQKRRLRPRGVRGNPLHGSLPGRVQYLPPPAASYNLGGSGQADALSQANTIKMALSEAGDQAVKKVREEFEKSRQELSFARGDAGNMPPGADADPGRQLVVMGGGAPSTVPGTPMGSPGMSSVGSPPVVAQPASTPGRDTRRDTRTPGTDTRRDTRTPRTASEMLLPGESFTDAYRRLYPR